MYFIWFYTIFGSKYFQNTFFFLTYLKYLLQLFLVSPSFTFLFRALVVELCNNNNNNNNIFEVINLTLNFFFFFFLLSLHIFFCSIEPKYADEINSSWGHIPNNEILFYVQGDNAFAKKFCQSIAQLTELKLYLVHVLLRFYIRKTMKMLSICVINSVSVKHLDSIGPMSSDNRRGNQ